MVMLHIGTIAATTAITYLRLLVSKSCLQLKLRLPHRLRRGADELVDVKAARGGGGAALGGKRD